MNLQYVTFLFLFSLFCLPFFITEKIYLSFIPNNKRQKFSIFCLGVFHPAHSLFSLTIQPTRPPYWSSTCTACSPTRPTRLLLCPVRPPLTAFLFLASRVTKPRLGLDHRLPLSFPEITPVTLPEIGSPQSLGGGGRPPTEPAPAIGGATGTRRRSSSRPTGSG
jgi:hypothetical protein